MRNSRGSNARGVSTGDIVHVIHGTTAFTLGIFTGSTANQGEHDRLDRLERRVQRLAYADGALESVTFEF